jgi:hypothetical protein
MPIKNYTTSVNYQKSLAEIQVKLSMAGATKIMIDNDKNKLPSAISFAINVPTDEGVNSIAFKLPMNVNKVQKVLQNQKVAPRYRTTEHAYNVGWKIIRDWVDSQLAIIETELVELPEVFLPYITDGNRTFYEKLVDSKFKGIPMLLSEGKE